MIRKFLVATAAIAALGTVSLTLSAAPAAAKGGHHHHGHRHGIGLYVGEPSYAFVDTCLKRVWVDTAFGPRRRLVNVCE